MTPTVLVAETIYLAPTSKSQNTNQKIINMKHMLAILIIATSFTAALCQDTKEAVMEKRARELHRIIGLSDEAQWRKYIQENYTQALIDKPMRTAVKEGDQGPAVTSEVKSSNNLDAKVKMFGRLHDDFGGAKLVSIKSTGETLNMNLDNGDGLIGTFKLKFENNKPYRIDGIGIQAGN